MNINNQLDQLAKRYDTGEFTDAQYLAEITKVCSAPPKPQTDYVVHNEGSIFLVMPLTRNAAQNLDENTGDDANFVGGALVVEPRFVAGFVERLRTEGWTVS